MSNLIEVKIPDIGDFKDVEIIEILVAVGDSVKPEQSLLTVESDKASMEIPCSHAGVVKQLKVKLGDKVGQGSLILLLEATQVSDSTAAAATPHAPVSATASQPEQPAHSPKAAPTVAPTPANAPASAASPAAVEALSVDRSEIASLPHASPSVRKFARELGVDLERVSGSGPKQRITEDDVRQFVKQSLAKLVSAGSASGVQDGTALGLIPWPKVDFAKFGPVQTQPLARIKKLSGANLHRNWVMIPHVTNHDDADITELEAFRVQLNKENEKSNLKLTMLAFLVKAVVSALKKFPEFNSSLDGDQQVLKQYYHIGFAADTPNGLMVPVIKDADKKGIFAIAQETADLAKKAREGKLLPSDMQGGTFSISSLGGIGGTYFTPIINAPEVAILGVCRSTTRPVWDGKQFVPRLILPLSLSWDHRVIDGASAARFNTYLAQLLADFRRVML